jgi:exosortase/archaeosortase family protein
VITPARKSVLAAAAVLFAAWTWRNAARVLLDDDQLVLYCLGTVFALAILFRHKPRPTAATLRDPWSGWPLLSGVGLVLSAVGLVFRVHQFEWLGVILMLFGCLRWALPERYGSDLLLAFALLYWANPLPGQVVGRMHLWLQLLSVRGSEALLHLVNVRVWGDGLMLRTGFRAFGVPEACSGFRTATTVAVSMLGTAILLRFRWFAGALLLVIAIAQVLALNVLRISFMVYWAPRMPPEWAERFLHDTLGVFLLLGIVLAQVEALAWKRFVTRRREVRDGILRGEVEVPEKASVLPRLWTLLFRWTPVAALAAAILLGAALTIYRSRPYHRATMIGGVVPGLMQTNPEAAERAVAVALKLQPGDRDLKGQRARVLALRGKHEAALGALDALGGNLSAVDLIFRSWLLLSLGRLEEAVAIVDELPPEFLNRPAVAMVRAEYALREGQPAEVARHLRRVGRSHLFIQRIRALFPYLAMHEAWGTICAVDTPYPYGNAIEALIAIQAFLKENDVGGAGAAARRALDRWPDDPRLLGPVFVLAMVQPEGGWDDRAAAGLRSNLQRLGVDEIATYMGYALRMGRPDIGWIAFNRLTAMDPDDPAIPLAVAQHAPSWFRLRKHGLGLRDEDPLAAVDARPLYRWSRTLRQFAPLWKAMPVMEELATRPLEEIRNRAVARCLAELQRRETAGTLDTRLMMDYPVALTLASRYDEAHERWNRIEQALPERRGMVLLQRARLFDMQARWESAYEELRQYAEAEEGPNLTATLLRVSALMQLGLGEQAMDEVLKGRRLFPAAQQVDLACSAILDVFGFKEDALFVLTRGGLDPGSRAAVQLLYDTGRVAEAQRRASALGIGLDRRDGRVVEALLPPAAEWVVAPRWPAPLTPAEMDEAAANARQAAARATGPFLQALARRNEAWFASQGGAAESVPELWEAAGRDAAERMSALKQLAVLLTRQGRREEASAAMDRALAHSPENPLLWRVRVALAKGDPEMVRRARAAAPDDGFLWLAHLVAKTEAEGVGPWMEEEALRAVSSQAYAPGILVRAGDFLLRKNAPHAASLLARDAMARGLGLPSSFALGTRCAIVLRDSKWALDCALKGIENVSNPGPFYRVVVAVKSVGGQRDRDLLDALEFLRKHSQQEPEWGERLGQAYFDRGDTRRALAVFAEVLSEDFKNVRVKSLLMAAEASRLQGDTSRSIDVLEAAYTLYPRRVSLLNNLIFTLAQNPSTLPRARELLPQLLTEQEADNFAVLDTAALVHLRSGNLAEAERYMKRALEHLDDEAYGALEVRLNAAELDYRQGNFEAAEAQLRKIRSSQDLNQVVDSAARRLQDLIRERNP